MAPRTWRRPYTAIYDDNYKFGNSLYSGTLDSIEKKYHETLRQTHVRSDRPDLAMTSFAGSIVTSGPLPTTSDPVVPRLRGGGSPSSPRPRVRPEMPPSLTESDFLGPRIRPLDFEITLPTTRSALADDEFFAEIEDRKARRKRKKRIERADMMDQFAEEITQSQDSSYWADKCRDLQHELEQVSQSLVEAESRIKSEVIGTKGKIQNELTELAMALDASNQQNLELQKVIKKQAKQVIELQSNYEDVQRHLQGTMEQLESSQRRCQILKSEIDNLRSCVEQPIRSKRL
ncbi:paramyosin, short form-like [Centruroides vittatus]|uniref:paramyosin, short form-like n=1 Tax=Centruroides vittatus TaxID=120091 RepID=UPI00350F2A68